MGRYSRNLYEVSPTRIFTGKSCKRGHIAERRISNGNCVECPNSPSRIKHRKESARRNRMAKKILVIQHYSQGSMSCKCCGENEIAFLQADHIENDGAAHRKEIRE